MQNNHMNYVKSKYILEEQDNGKTEWWKMEGDRGADSGKDLQGFLRKQ